MRDWGRSSVAVGTVPALTLSVAELAAERGGRQVFANLTFALRAGEILGVTGPNGAGKSTLLRVLAGLLAAAAGRVALDPADAADPDAPVRERAHYVGHADALKAALTPLENLRFAAGVCGHHGVAPAAALRRLGLSHAADLPCGLLSAGQRRRVALARLLVAERPLWLLDEPATALDAGAREGLGDLMRRHLAGGGLIVAATHAPLGLPTRELRLGGG